MRHIQIEQDFSVRFPNRSNDFDEGVEVGMLAALMTLKTPVITRWIGGQTIEQVLTLAARLGYRVMAEDEWDGDRTKVTLMSTAVRPKLRIVS